MKKGAACGRALVLRSGPAYEFGGVVLVGASVGGVGSVVAVGGVCGTAAGASVVGAGGKVTRGGFACVGAVVVSAE